MTQVNYNLPVLVVDPEPAQRTALCEMLTSQGQSVDTAPDGMSAAKMIGSKSYKLVMADTALSSESGLSLIREASRTRDLTPVVLMSDRGEVKEAVEAIRMGAMDFLIRPISSEIIQQILNKLAEMNRTASRARSDFKAKAKVARNIVTASQEMKRLMQIAKAVAPSMATVLISGQSGTGKELFARYIHSHSDRAEGTFLAVNCAALPENLLESELFGHEKGAFTGAVTRKPGKFELAAGGTLLLDEISEMDLSLQAKLLRVLQESEVDLVGGRAPMPVDVRVLATTNRRLAEEVEKGNFREDLFYRLNVIPLHLPSLRERPEDVEPLALYFLEKHSRNNRKPDLSFAPATLDTLQAHPWPGNVRELENIIERAVLLCQGRTVQPQDLLMNVGTGEAGHRQAVNFTQVMTIREMEQSMIEAALGETNGNRTHAAKMLGISVRTLRNKLNEYRQDGVPHQAAAAMGG